MIADGILRDYADQVLAVAGNVIVGVFDVLRWDRDQASAEVAFTLRPAAEWQFVIGMASPVTWHKGQANPVRKLGGVHVDLLRSRRPHTIDAGGGWFLDVAPDGMTACVRGPGPLAVTAMNGQSITIATA